MYANDIEEELEIEINNIRDNFRIQRKNRCKGFASKITTIIGCVSSIILVFSLWVIFLTVYPTTSMLISIISIVILLLLEFGISFFTCYLYESIHRIYYIDKDGYEIPVPSIKYENEEINNITKIIINKHILYNIG